MVKPNSQVWLNKGNVGALWSLWWQNGQRHWWRQRQTMCFGFFWVSVVKEFELKGRRGCVWPRGPGCESRTPWARRYKEPFRVGLSAMNISDWFKDSSIYFSHHFEISVAANTLFRREHTSKIQALWSTYLEEDIQRELKTATCNKNKIFRWCSCCCIAFWITTTCRTEVEQPFVAIGFWICQQAYFTLLPRRPEHCKYMHFWTKKENWQSNEAEALRSSPTGHIWHIWYLSTFRSASRGYGD